MFKLNFSLIFVISILTTPAYTYIGPGMGVGIIVTTFGVIVAIIVALLGIIYFPIKRLLKKRKQKKTNKQK